MAKFWIYPESFNGGNGWDSGTFASIDDPFSNPDDDLTIVQRTSAGSDDFTTRYNLTPFVPSATSINSVLGVVRIRRAALSGGQATVGVFISGVDHYGTLTNLADTHLNFTKLWTVNPQTVAAWTVAELNALIGSSRTMAPGTGRIYNWTQMYFEVDYVGAPSPSNPALDAASRRLHGYSTPRSFVSLASPLNLALDVQPGDFHRLEHFAGPHPAEAGWKRKIWQTRLVRVHEVTVQPGVGEGTIKYHDLRPKLAFLRDDAWTPKPANALGDGVCRFSALGEAHAYGRSSQTWVDDPASRLFMALSDHQVPFNFAGVSFQAASKNWIIQSGFQTGDITGWTKVGTGTNGSAITRILVADGIFYDAALTLPTLAGGMWEPDSTGVIQHFSIIAGVPHTVDTYLLSTASGTITASTKLWLSIWHARIQGDPLRYTVQRGVDSLYWRASDQAWVAGPIWNVIAAPAADLVWTRYTVPNQIDVGASNTTITCRIGYDAAAADDSKTRINAFLFEDGPLPSLAPILNAGTALTRAADSYQWGQAIWNGGAFGAFLCEVIPNWTPAMIGSANKVVFSMTHDANNWDRLYYEGANDRWVFSRNAQGTNNLAVFSHSPSQGVPVRLGVRFTGNEGELDLADFTASIFVDHDGDGVLTKGTDVVCNNAPTAPDADDVFEVGSNAGIQHFDGIIRMMRMCPFVPTDAEMTRLFYVVG